MSDSLSFFREFVSCQDNFFYTRSNDKSDTSQILIVQTGITNDNTIKNSIFSNHTLKPLNTVPVIKEKHTESILGLPIILSVFVFATMVKYLYGKRLNMITRAFTGSRFVNQLVREGNIFNERITLPLFIIFLLNTSIFLWITAKYFYFDLSFLRNNHIVFLSLIIITFSYYLMQILGSSFLGYLFKAKQLAYQMKIIIQIFNMVLGIILLPIIPFLIFNPIEILFYISIAIIIIVLVWKILRIIHINFNEPKFSQYYLFLFLYLCSVEIIPMIIIIKLLTLVL